MKHYILVLHLLCTVILGSAQTSSLKKVNSTEIEADQIIGIDKFNNSYYINQNTIFKKTASSETMAFQDVLLGDVEKVDILNPNKISVFYKMANTVVVLDNRMTEILRLDFNNISPYRNIGFLGTSKDQSLWIYNMDSNLLELYDYRQKKLLFQTLPIDDEIIELKSNFNLCYLRTSSKILVYNIYGSFIGDVAVKDFKSYDLYKNQLVIHQGNRLNFYNQNLELKESIEINFKDYENLLFAGENLYIYNDNKLTTYAINM